MSALLASAAAAPYRIHRYPSMLIDRVTLADARIVTVRPVLPQDVDAERAFVSELSPRSRRLRFHGAVNALPDSQLQAMTAIDYQVHVALIAEAIDELAVELVPGDRRHLVSRGSVLREELALPDRSPDPVSLVPRRRIDLLHQIHPLERRLGFLGWALELRVVPRPLSNALGHRLGRGPRASAGNCLRRGVDGRRAGTQRARALGGHGRRAPERRRLRLGRCTGAHQEHPVGRSGAIHHGHLVLLAGEVATAIHSRDRAPTGLVERR